MTVRPAAGGGRWVDVPPERLRRWLDNFAIRHGAVRADGLTVTGADGATAELGLPIGAPAVPDVEGLIAVATADRRLGLLLARKGAVAVGVAEGGTLVASKVDTH